MKAFQEIGIKNTLQFIFYTFLMSFFRCLLFPPLRTHYLRLFGAKVGKDTVINDIKLINLHCHGLRPLSIGNYCFFGVEVMLDLADTIIFEDHVTLSSRVLVLSHFNVGYKDHPLQPYVHRITKGVVFKRGSFVGAGAIIMPGVTIGAGGVVGAGAVVVKDVRPWTVVAGVPAKKIKRIK